MNKDVSEHQRQALDQFGFRSAVPLFRRIGEEADHLATGIFFALGDRLLLVTARHVLDKCAPEDVAITTSPEGSPLFTLGNLTVHKPVDVPGAEIDIVAFEILDAETSRVVSDGWRIVEMSIGDEALGTGEMTPNRISVRDPAICRHKHDGASHGNYHRPSVRTAGRC